MQKLRFQMWLNNADVFSLICFIPLLDAPLIHSSKTCCFSNTTKCCCLQSKPTTRICFPHVLVYQTYSIKFIIIFFLHLTYNSPYLQPLTYANHRFFQPHNLATDASRSIFQDVLFVEQRAGSLEQEQGGGCIPGVSNFRLQSKWPWRSRIIQQISKLS